MRKRNLAVLFLLTTTAIVIGIFMGIYGGYREGLDTVPTPTPTPILNSDAKLQIEFAEINNKLNKLNDQFADTTPTVAPIPTSKYDLVDAKT
jgi:hypothetical protein